MLQTINVEYWPDHYTYVVTIDEGGRQITGFSAVYFPKGRGQLLPTPLCIRKPAPTEYRPIHLSFKKPDYAANS